MKRAILLLAIATPLFAQETRIASDYEIRTMQEQAASAKDFSTQVSAHMNLGDLRLSRNETTLAEQEFAIALAASEQQRKAARESSNIPDYATATLYAGLAEANLHHEPRAFELLEEGVRYIGDDARLWNVYATGMARLHLMRKAISGSRNAVALEKEPVDLAINMYSLAISLDQAGETKEAEEVLEAVISLLRSPKFDAIRKQVARHEDFQTYSTVRGDVAAYLTVLNRAQLDLAGLYEDRGEHERARGVYEEVLKARTDDPTALAAIARIKGTPDAYGEAFDANPFAPDLIHNYQSFLLRAKPHTEGTSNGAMMRRAIEQIARGEDVNARKTLDELHAKFPQNDTIQSLYQELGTNANGKAFLKDLRATLAILATDRATPEQRAEMDRTMITASATFDAMPFYSGTVDDVPFRFSQPATFNGTFAAKTPLHLTFRILGATELNGGSALLLEPVKVAP